MEMGKEAEVGNVNQDPYQLEQHILYHLSVLLDHLREGMATWGWRRRVNEGNENQEGDGGDTRD
ncbi:hypothetical protein PISMIDRAFT_687701, partial [Pisolithus microcarpus 441]